MEQQLAECVVTNLGNESVRSQLPSVTSQGNRPPEISLPAPASCKVETVKVKDEFFLEGHMAV